MLSRGIGEGGAADLPGAMDARSWLKRREKLARSGANYGRGKPVDRHRVRAKAMFPGGDRVESRRGGGVAARAGGSVTRREVACLCARNDV